MSARSDLTKGQATLLLGAVIVAATAVRWLRAPFALPYLGYFDEPLVVNSGLRILESGSYSPFTFGYGSLAIYISALCSAVTFLMATSKGMVRDLDTWVSRDHELVTALGGATYAPGGYAASRAVFAAIGVLSVVAVYRMARALGASRGASVVAGSLVVLHPLQLISGFTATVDGPAAALTACALVVAILSVRTAKLPPMLSAAALGAMACAFKPSMAPFLGALVVAAGVSARGTTMPTRFGRMLMPLLIVGAGILVIEPFIWFTPSAFLRSFGKVLFHNNALGHTGQADVGPWGVFARLGASLSTGSRPADVALVAFLAVGLVRSLRRWRQAIVLLVAVGGYVWVVAHLRVYFDRVALPLLAPLLALCAVGLSAAFRAIPRMRHAAIAARVLRLAVAVAVAAVFAGQLRESSAFAKYVDTRVLAENWLLTHLVPGETVAATAQLGLAPTRLKARAVQIDTVDPWTAPCWRRETTASYLVTDMRTLPEAAPPIAQWPGTPVFALQPFLSPNVFIYRIRTENAGACDTPEYKRRLPFPLAMAGQGVRRRIDPGGEVQMELGADGWLLSSAVANGGAAALEFSANLLPAEMVTPRGDRIDVILRAVVGDRDVCISRIALPRATPVRFQCQAAGLDAVAFHLFHNIEPEMSSAGWAAIVLRDLAVTGVDSTPTP